jgi:hypothetical protein
MDFTDLVGNSGVEQDPLSRGGLTGIDVRHDTDIPVTLKWSLSRHCIYSVSGSGWI